MSNLTKSFSKNIMRSNNSFYLANKRFQQDFENMLKKLKIRNYKESNEIITKILNEHPKLKASRGYIELMNLKAKSLFFLREYREAELMHMNIVEYGKYNYEKKKENYGIKDRFKDYCELLRMLIYSNLDVVVLIFMNLLNKNFRYHIG